MDARDQTDALIQAHHDSMPAEFQSGLREPVAPVLTGIVPHLLQFDQRREPHPLIVFVDILIDRMKDIAPRLKKWKTSAGRPIAGSGTRPRSHGTNIHLLIELETRRVGKEEKLAVKHAFHSEAAGWEPAPEFDWEKYAHENQCIRKNGECLFKPEQVSGVISALIDSMPKTWTERLTDIELTVPPGFLDLPVDQWKRNPRLLYNMGQHYCIAMRIGNRFELPEFHTNWRSKWETLNRKLNVPVCDQSLWHEAEDGEDENLEDLCLDCLSEEITGLTSTYYPDCKGVSIAEVIVQSGIPMALIHRRTKADMDHAGHTATTLRQITETCCPPQLKQAIREIRKTAKKADDPGNHFILVWDDPEKIIPGF